MPAVKREMPAVKRDRWPAQRRKSARISEYHERALLAETLLTADHHVNVFILSQLTAAEVGLTAQVNRSARKLCCDIHLWTVLYDTKWPNRQPAGIVPTTASFKQRATLPHATAPTEKLPGYSYPAETYTFHLSVTCGSQMLFHGEHSLELRDDHTKLPSIVITNTVAEANQFIPPIEERLEWQGELVLVRHSDQAMALVWSLQPHSYNFYEDGEINFGNPDFECDIYADDVGYGIRERHYSILEHRKTHCDVLFEDRYLLLMARLVPVGNNDGVRRLASSVIDAKVIVESSWDTDYKELVTSRDLVSCLAVSALNWHAPGQMVTRQRASLLSSHEPLVIEKLPGYSYPAETYTFHLSVTCGSQMLFHGEHTLELRDDHTKLPSIVITNTVAEANQFIPPIEERLEWQGELVLVRHSDQAMALVWSLQPHSYNFYEDGEINFGNPDFECDIYADDVGYGIRERHYSILEHRNIRCHECCEDRYLLLMARLVPVGNNDGVRRLASSVIDAKVIVESSWDTDYKELVTSRDLVSCLAESALNWHPL